MVIQRGCEVDGCSTMALKRAINSDQTQVINTYPIEFGTPPPVQQYLSGEVEARISKCVSDAKPEVCVQCEYDPASYRSFSDLDVARLRILFEDAEIVGR
jgi:hypothetical protein